MTKSTKMPGLIIGVNEFIEETREDYNSPTTSTFVSRMGQCRQTIATLEEVIIIRPSSLTSVSSITIPVIPFLG